MGTFQVLKLPLGFIRVLEWVRYYFNSFSLFLCIFFLATETEKNTHAACLFFESSNWCNFIASFGFWCVGVGVFLGFHGVMDLPHLVPFPNSTKLLKYMSCLFSVSVKFACQGSDYVVRFFVQHRAPVSRIVPVSLQW